MRLKPTPFITLYVITMLLACSGGNPQPRPPAHERQSTYYVNHGVELLNQGCFADALDYFQDAHQRFTAADNLVGVARSLNNIADLYYRLDRPTDALAVYDDAISVFRQSSDSEGLVQALSNKAAALIALERLQEAENLLDQADAAAAADTHVALRLKIRALVAIDKNDLAGAETLLTRALSAADGVVLSSIHFAIGYVALKRQQPERACQAFDQALAIDRKKGAFYDIARDLDALGQCRAAEGDHAQAVNYYKRSAKIFALLHREDKVKAVVARLGQSAGRTDIPTEATLFWVNQWLTDPATVSLCD